MMSGVSAGGSEPSGGVIESVGFICLTCLCVAAGIALAAHTAGAPARQVVLQIDDTINPNDASPASLARLPRIGPARAREIVSYRSRFGGGSAQRPVFRRAEDLPESTGTRRYSSSMNLRIASFRPEAFINQADLDASESG